MTFEVLKLEMSRLVKALQALNILLIFITFSVLKPEMLRLVTEHARRIGMDKLRLSVERSNEPSVKTIIKNGGKYERSFFFDGEEADVYVIMLITDP